MYFEITNLDETVFKWFSRFDTKITILASIVVWKKRVWWDVSLHQNKLVASPKNIFRVWIWYRCVPQNIRKHVGKYFGSIEHILSPVAVGKDHLCNFENLTLNPPSTWTPQKCNFEQIFSFFKFQIAPEISNRLRSCSTRA